MARLRTRPHPIAAFLAYLILGPFLLAAALLVGAVAVACYLLSAVIWVASGRRVA